MPCIHYFMQSFYDFFSLYFLYISKLITTYYYLLTALNYAISRHNKAVGFGLHD